MDNTNISSGNSNKQAPGSVGMRGFDSVSGLGAQDGVRSVTRTNTANSVANVSERVVNGKTNIKRLENTTRDAHIRAFLADIALLELQAKTFGDEMEQSKFSEASIDAFEKALHAFEAGIDLFNARMDTFQALASTT